MLSRRRAALIVLALTIAGGWLRFEAAESPSRYQSADERAYARLALQIVRQHNIEVPMFQDPTRWAPGGPVLFAAAQRLHPQRLDPARLDIPSAYVAQAAVGTALIPTVFVLAALIAGPAAGVLAAGAVAFYPPLITASSHLLTEPLGALVIALALIAVVLALRRPGGPTFATARGAALRASAGALAGLTLTMGAWSMYASIVAGRPVPVSSGGASNLYVGTYLPGDGSMFGLKHAWAQGVA